MRDFGKSNSKKAADKGSLFTKKYCDTSSPESIVNEYRTNFVCVFDISLSDPNEIRTIEEIDGTINYGH